MNTPALPPDTGTANERDLTASMAYELAAILAQVDADIRAAATENVKRHRAAVAFAAALSVGACTSPARPEPAIPSVLHEMVNRAADKHGVPRRIAHGVVRVESGYRCKARNPRSGATGIMQVMPATARGVGVHGKLTECKTGLEAGMRYLRQALNRGGEGCAGVSLYERGIFAQPTCTGYGKRVMGAKR